MACVFPDSKVHGANMGPTWVLSAPDGPHLGPMTLAIRVPNIKVERWRDPIIFISEIHILVKWHLYIETTPLSAHWKYLHWLYILVQFLVTINSCRAPFGWKFGAYTGSSDWLNNAFRLFNWETWTFDLILKSTSFIACATYFLTFWNFTENILEIYWKIQFSYGTVIL